MQYPYKSEKTASGGYVFQLIDIPEVIAFGQTPEEAEAETLSAFLSYAEWLFDDGLLIPLPSNANCQTIHIPASTAAKILLLNAMTETNMRHVDIADKAGVTRQEMTRITSLRRKTKIDTLEKAISATGKTLQLSAV